MTRTLSLHIGSPKTGTSALQVFLARNREALEAVGCHYPSNDDVDRAAGGVITSGNALGMAKFLNPNLRHRVSVDAWLADLRSLLADDTTGPRQIVYSSEFLWRACPERLPELNELIVEAGFEPRIVAYVRAQDGWAISQYSQLVKRHHETAPLDDAVRAMEIDVVGVLDGFAAAFGTSSMRVRVYDPDQFVGGSLITDFVAQLDLPPTFSGAVATDEVRVNPSLSLQDSETMRFLNRFRLPMPLMHEVPAACRRVRRDPSRQDPLALSPSSSDALRERHRADAEIGERYLLDQELRFVAPVSTGRRFPPPSRAFSSVVAVVAAWMLLRRRLGRRWSRRSP